MKRLGRLANMEVSDLSAPIDVYSEWVDAAGKYLSGAPAEKLRILTSLQMPWLKRRATQSRHRHNDRAPDRVRVVADTGMTMMSAGTMVRVLLTMRMTTSHLRFVFPSMASGLS